MTTPRSSLAYGYDENGRISSVHTSSGRGKAYTYDEKGGVASEEYPDGVRGWRYEYGANGVVTAIVSKDSKLRYNYERDSAGRIVRASVVRKKETATASASMSSSPKLLGAPLRGGGGDDEEESSVQNMVYDDKGQLVQFTSGTHTIDITYDEEGRKTSIIDEDGDGERYTYDDCGRISQVIDAKDDALVHVTYAYDDDHGGRLASQTFSNGMVTSYGYDTIGRITAVTHVRNDETLADFRYEYDGCGKLLVSRNEVTGEQNDFSYDADGNLAKIVYTDQDGNTFDSAKDAKKVKVVVDDVTGGIVKMKTEDDTWACVYDALNNLIGIENEDGTKSAEYKVDAFGNFEEETIGNKKVSKVIVPGTDQVVNIYEDGTKTHFISSSSGSAVGSTSPKGTNYYIKDKNKKKQGYSGGSGGGSGGGSNSGGGFCAFDRNNPSPVYGPSVYKEREENGYWTRPWDPPKSQPEQNDGSSDQSGGGESGVGNVDDNNSGGSDNSNHEDEVWDNLKDATSRVVQEVVLAGLDVIPPNPVTDVIKEALQDADAVRDYAESLRDSENTEEVIANSGDYVATVSLTHIPVVGNVIDYTDRILRQLPKAGDNLGHWIYECERARMGK